MQDGTSRCLSGTAAGDRAANDPGAEGNRELLADFAVAVFNEVVRIGIDADDPGALDLEAGLLKRFADDGIGDPMRSS